MHFLVKFGDHKSHGIGDINSYINSYMDFLEKAELTASISHIGRNFPILQFPSSGYGWQKS